MKNVTGREFCFFLMIIFILPLSLHADDKNDDAWKYHFFSESLILYLPLAGGTGDNPGLYEENIYPFGMGGGLAYETTLANRIFSDAHALPGIVIGCSAALYMMEPQQIYAEEFGELTIITAGIYAGYEFLILATEEISILPLISAGARYYVSFHFFMDELSFAYNPIIISRAGVKIVRNRVFSLQAAIEYQVFMENIPRQTLSISLENGVFF